MIGIFGGSFDPIHFGHIKLVLTLLEHYDFENIRLIPCQLSPHKKKTYASAKHRFAMLNLVTASNDKLIADDRELRRAGVSYTIDTLRELREEIGVKKAIVMIAGVDAYASFCEWHEYAEILSLCHIMLLQRPTYELPNEGCEKELYDSCNTNDIYDLKDKSNGYIYLCNEEKYDISSTDIRQTIRSGQQPRYFLPGNIWNYIRRNELYKK